MIADWFNASKVTLLPVTAATPAGIAAYWPEIVELVTTSIWFCTKTPDPDSAMPVLPADVATDPAKLMALIFAFDLAVTLTAPSALTSLWSMIARTRTG